MYHYPKARRERTHPELNVGDKVKILRKKAITEKEKDISLFER